VSGHTPGPWEIAPHPDDAEVLEIVSEYSEQPGGRKVANWIAQCDAGIDNDDDFDVQLQRNKANARLIAAAPELLAELKNIANANPSTWDADLRDQFRPWAQNRARAAVAKAEGRS
jgi:hypothetical protein